MIISTILVVALGFAVDYSGHIGHAFMAVRKGNRNGERCIFANLISIVVLWVKCLLFKHFHSTRVHGVLFGK